MWKSLVDLESSEKTIAIVGDRWLATDGEKGSG